MAELFAATYPERTSALVLMNATARISAAPGYEIGAPPEVQEGLVSMVEQTWGRGDIIAAINPSLAGDSAAIEAWGRFLRLSASPATAAAVMRMLFELDVRDVLPSIRVPTLIVHRRDNPIVTVEQGRYVAEHIEGASFVAVPGADYGPTSSIPLHGRSSWATRGGGSCSRDTTSWRRPKSRGSAERSSTSRVTGCS